MRKEGKSPQFVSNKKWLMQVGIQLWQKALKSQILCDWCNRGLLRWPGLGTEAQPVKTDCDSWLYGWNLMLFQWQGCLNLGEGLSLCRGHVVTAPEGRHHPCPLHTRLHRAAPTSPPHFRLLQSFRWQWYFRTRKEKRRVQYCSYPLIVTPK